MCAMNNWSRELPKFTVEVVERFIKYIVGETEGMLYQWRC